MVKLDELMAHSSETEEKDVLFTLWNYKEEDLGTVLGLYRDAREALTKEKPALAYGALIILMSECLRLYDRDPKTKKDLLSAVTNDLGRISGLLDISASKNAPTTDRLQ
jgi:hypothetical protein